MTVDSILNQIIHKRISSDASLYLGKSRHPSATQANRKPRLSFPIVFPDPPPLLPELLSIGVDESAALDINHIYTSKAADLLQKNQAAIEHLLGEIAQIPSPHISVSHQQELIVHTVVSIYMRNLQTWVHEAKVMCQDHLPRLQQSKVPASDRPMGETKFNHAYVPLLEHFFDENPFPTHADKVFLAQKSSMTYRQIHIWFQNRRNRTKKEGKILKKKPISEGVTLPLDSLYRRMEKFIKPEERRVNVLQLSSSSSATDHEAQPSSIRDASYNNPLESLAPPHAFPLSYPPSCSYDPFPSRNGTTNFGAPKWLRLPTNTIVQRPSLDIDALIDRFSRMNVLDDSSSRLRGKDNSFAAVVAITIIPPSAPHPAFIRGAPPHITAVCSPLSSVPATAPRRHVFNTPSPQSRPVTLIPTTETSTTQKRRVRKVAPLPRRVPHGNPIHRDVTPAMSETSVASPSPSSPSWSSSFGSGSSSQSRLFSSTSSTSDSSSSIVTPPSSPSLPTQLASPSVSLFSFSSNTTDMFGDALQGTPSPVEGLQLDFNPSVLGESLNQKSPSFGFSFNAPSAANLIRTLS